MEPDATTVARIKQMAHEGKTIAQIGKDLGVDYWEVWNHAERSWRGTKWVITNRLNQLKTERDPDARIQLANEAAECVEYLYRRGIRMGDQIQRARNTLDS